MKCGKNILASIIVYSIVILLSYLSNMCIVDPSLHEWLHHIGACISGIPNIQLPTQTILLTPCLILPEQSLQIPLMDISTTFNFPYLITRLVLLIPLIISTILTMVGWWKDLPLLFSISFSITVTLIIICILVIPWVNEQNIIEWINNILQYII